MDLSIFGSCVLLFQMICVVIVFAYLFTRSKYFIEVLEHHPAIRTQVFLTLVFGILSIYGLSSGVNVYGATLTFRDLGPVIAGLLCGPFVGLGAGLIGGVYRLTMGGSNVYAAAAGPVIAGLFTGLVWWYNKREFVSIRAAVVLTIIIESFVSALALVIRVMNGASPQELMKIILNVAFPMILLTAVAVGIFAFIIHNLVNERRVQREKEALEREIARKDAELQIAAEIQKSFLPDIIPQIEGFDIAGTSIPAKEVGGDFFDVMPFEVIPFNKQRMGVMIADVSGKGVPAALFMALSRIVIRVSATWFSRSSEAIAYANPIISRDSKTGMFVTVFYGVLDNATRNLTYVNAGHNPPILLRAGSSTAEELEATGIAIGAMDDAAYEQREVSLASGDVIVLYTDGVTEAVNDREEMFEIPRLMDVIMRTREGSARGMVEAIIAAVTEFSKGQPQYDDITLMVVKVQ
jgi:phosphoserine phosphatase RsbU/P